MFENYICLLASKQFRATMLSTIKTLIAVGLNRKFLEKKINNAK